MKVLAIIGWYYVICNLVAITGLTLLVMLSVFFGTDSRKVNRPGCCFYKEKFK